MPDSQKPTTQSPKKASPVVKRTAKGIALARKHIDAATKLRRMGRAGVLKDEDFEQALIESGDEKCVSLGYALQDPQYNKYTLPELFALHGLGWKDIVAAIESTRLSIARVQQIQHAPQILDTNARAAIGKKILCPTCNGEKRILKACSCHPKKRKFCAACAGSGVVDKGPCLTCNEEGWIMDAGHAVALKGFMDSTGMSGSKGPLIQLNQNFGPTGRFEDLMRDLERKTQNALPQAKVVEVTPE